MIIYYPRRGTRYAMLHYIILYSAILYHTIPYHTILRYIGDYNLPLKKEAMNQLEAEDSTSELRRATTRLHTTGLAVASLKLWFEFRNHIIYYISLYYGKSLNK